MEGIEKFKNREELLGKISDQMENSKWVFISTEELEPEKTLLMSPDRNLAFECILRVLKQEPEWYSTIKTIIDK